METQPTPDPQAMDRTDILYPPEPEPAAEAPPEQAEPEGEQMHTPEPEAHKPEGEQMHTPEPEAEELPEIVQQEADAEEQPAEEVTEPEAEEEPPEIVQQEGEVEEVEVTTFEQLGEHLEVDDEWLGGLKLSRSIRGEEQEFTLSDAIDTHMQVESGQKYLDEAKQKKAEAMAEVQSVKDALGPKIAELGGMVELFEKQLQIEYNPDEMAKLRQQDPAEWAAKQEEQKQRAGALDQLKGVFAQKYNETLEAIEEQNKKAREEALPAEQEALLSRLPEWSDPKKAEPEVTKVLEYLRTDGWSDQALAEIVYNGRALATATKAMRYDQMKGASQVAKKKVTKIPKIMKAGSKATEDRKASAEPKDRADILYGR